MEKRRLYRLTEEHKAYMRAYLKEWRKRNPGRMRAYDDKWRAANPDIARESDRKKHQKLYKKRYQDPAFRAKAVIRATQWMKDNPQRSKILRSDISHRRRARIMGSQTGPIDYDQLMLDSNGLCGICGEMLVEPLELDHIIPIAKGGPHTQDNLQFTHALCNRRKNSRLMPYPLLIPMSDPIMQVPAAN
jgi:5-methylcytosine-specific restriction endonuclease McrA